MNTPLTYTRDQLIALNCIPKIQRSARKALFAHSILKHQGTANPILGWTTVKRTKHSVKRVNAKPTNEASGVNTTSAEPALNPELPVLNKYAPLYLDSPSKKTTSGED